VSKQKDWTVYAKDYAQGHDLLRLKALQQIIPRSTTRWKLLNCRNGNKKIDPSPKKLDTGLSYILIFFVRSKANILSTIMGW
jgi:hypothetical protein